VAALEAASEGEGWWWASAHHGVGGDLAAHHDGTYKSIYKLIMLPEEKYHNSETDRLLIPVIGFS
jgi:hypothetical protein